MSNNYFNAYFQLVVCANSNKFIIMYYYCYYYYYIICI